MTEAPRTYRQFVPPSDEDVARELAGGPIAEPTRIEVPADAPYPGLFHKEDITPPWAIRSMARHHVGYGWAPSAGSHWGPPWTDQQRDIYHDAYDLECSRLAHELPGCLLNKTIAKLERSKVELARCEKVYQKGVTEGPTARNMWGREQQLNEAKRETARLTRLIAKIKTENKL